MPPKRPSATYASQAGPSQRRRPQAETQASLPSSDEEDDGDYADAPQTQGQGVGTQAGGSDGVAGVSGGSKGLTEAALSSKAGQLIKFALSQEYKRNLIRRSDITKHVLPHNPRWFNPVFARAQQTLRATIGCELVAVRPRKKGDPHAIAADAAAGADGEATQTQGRKGKGRASRVGGEDEEDDEDEDGNEAAPATQRAKSKSTNVYILRSILPPDLLAAMSNPAPLPLAAAEADNADGEDSGALIQWEKGDGTASGHIALLGVRTIILSVVMALGRIVSDDQLHAYLRRLNLHRDTILPYISPDSKEPPLTLDKYLDLLAKQAYLEKINVPPPANNPDAGTCDWRWGQREVEFSEKDAAMIIEEIMIGREEDESSDEEDDGNRRRNRNVEKVDKVKRRKKLREDIVKAAGGGVLYGTEWN